MTYGKIILTQQFQGLRTGLNLGKYFMTKEKIQALIFSENDDSKIIKKLNKWIQRAPSLLDEQYNCNETIFHLLVSANKHQIIKELLQETIWRNKALTLDDHKNSLLHYALQNENTHSKTLLMLITSLPELLNQANLLGNTPLHEAIITNKLAVIELLINHGAVDCLTTNAKGQNAYDLAGENQEFQKALRQIPLSLIQSLDLRYKKYHSLKDQIQAQLPLLSSPIATRSKHLPSIQILQNNASEKYYDLGDSKSFNIQNKVISVQEIIPLLKKLAHVYKKDPDSLVCQNLQKQFISMCEQYCLDDAFTQHPKELASKGIKEVLSITLNALNPTVEGLNAQRQDRSFNLLKIFIYMLKNQDFLLDAKPIDMPAQDFEDNKQKEFLSNLWLVTACQETMESSRQMQMQRIANQTLGLLCTYSAVDVLEGLQYLYPQFDKAQKAVANLVALQLLFYHAHNQIKLEPELYEHLQGLCRLNVDAEIGLDTLGEQVNKYLERACRLSSLMTDHPVLRNFYLINQLINNNQYSKNNSSFDILVDQALSVPRKHRTELVLQIAQELKLFTIATYQKIAIHDFLPKKNKESPSSSTRNATDIFNKLSDYFIEKILNQPKANVPNTLQFLIELATALCSLDQEEYPDLNNLMMLSGTLNDANISKLLMDTPLSDEDEAIFNEMMALTGGKQNFKLMRKVCTTYQSTLPYIGLFYTDVLFVVDGNSAFPSLEILGLVLRNIMEIKLLLNIAQISHQTNLPNLIAEYKIPSREELDDAFLRQNPRPTDILDLDTPETEFNTTLELLKDTYLAHNLLPSVLYKKQSHEHTALVSLLNSAFFRKVKDFCKTSKKTHQINKAEYHSLINAADKLLEIIREVDKINHNFYRDNSINVPMHSEYITKLKLKILDTEKEVGRQLSASEEIKIPHLHAASKQRSLTRRMSSFFLKKTTDEIEKADTPTRTNS
jgi:hypothetical protein